MMKSLCVWREGGGGGGGCARWKGNREGGGVDCECVSRQQTEEVMIGQEGGGAEGSQEALK